VSSAKDLPFRKFFYGTIVGMNIRTIIKPMPSRFFLLILLMFQLFELTSYLPDWTYWPSHVAALLLGLAFWRLMLKIAQVDQ